MNKGFNLSISDNSFLDYDEDMYYTKGKYLYKKFQKHTLSNLEKMLNKNIIDGDTLQNIWFPDENFNSENFVFISHSHNDEKTAIKLAGYLYKKFKILSFIDSCVWGNINKLNRELNDCSKNRYGDCYGCDCDDFSYNLSYVHMMLASALMNMIDKCECVFFLNTPSSINLNNKTESPWIYYELNIVNTIQRRISLPIMESGSYPYFIHKMEFTPKLQKMIKINEHTLMKWEDKYNLSNDDPFIVLYKICGGVD